MLGMLLPNLAECGIVHRCTVLADTTPGRRFTVNSLIRRPLLGCPCIEGCYCLGNPIPVCRYSQRSLTRRFLLPDPWRCSFSDLGVEGLGGFGHLRGSCIVIAGILSRVTVIITHIRGHLTTHEPPSKGSERHPGVKQFGVTVLRGICELSPVILQEYHGGLNSLTLWGINLVHACLTRNPIRSYSCC